MPRREREEARARQGQANKELFQAIVENDPRRVSTALACGADVNMRHLRNGDTPLLLAVSASRNPAIVKQLLDRGADVRARDEHRATPLHIAVAVRDKASIGLLLERGAEIDARDVDGWTPLHCAAALGRLEEAVLLVSRGADVGLRDREGLTPLEIARVHDPHEPLSEQRWGALERLLAGFATARVIEARPDSLVVRIESVQTIYPEAYRQAQERGMITIPAGLVHEVLEPGDVIRYSKGLSSELDEAWQAARRRELDIEPER